MTIGLLKEAGDERRVALLPEAVAMLKNLKTDVVVETGAGMKAFATDPDYKNAGAEVLSRNEVIQKAELLVFINTPENLSGIPAGKALIGAFNPLQDKDLVMNLAQQGLTTFSLDVIPRTTRAQAMDILSSMATVSGYKAVLTAANTAPKFFPMFMTAAGTITPAKVLILGAGVAGLQALATARKLGAVVEVFDVRAAVKEEVVGLGGKFVEVEGALDDKAAGGYAVEQTEEFKARQAAAIHDHAVRFDVLICTAQIPGKKAPVLIKKETVQAMKPGTVIIDLAASTGGNCELTQNDKTIVINDVTIIGNSKLATDMPSDASKMFGKNVINFLKLMITKEGALNLNWEDDLISGTCVTRDGQVVHERVKSIHNL
jgi:NAD(P) transhydrogenase subunit alpha